MSSAGRWASAATPAFETSFKGSAHVGLLIGSREQAMATLLADAVPPNELSTIGRLEQQGTSSSMTANAKFAKLAYGDRLLNFLGRIFRLQHGLRAYSAVCLSLMKTDQIQRLLVGEIPTTARFELPPPFPNCPKLRMPRKAWPYAFCSLSARSFPRTCLLTYLGRPRREL
jgi:hypothetical protein